MSDNNDHRGNNLNPRGGHFYQPSHHQDTQGYGQQPHPGYGQHNDQRGNGQQQYVQQHQNQQGYGRHQLPPRPPSQAYGGPEQQHIHPQTDTNVSDTRPLCHDYLLGKCKVGNTCRRQHPIALDAKQEKIVDFKFDTSVGVACARCVKFLLSCSIVSGEHTGGDNPCNDCFHFGGYDRAACVPSTSSYNDAAWDKMAIRPDFDWSLPEFERTINRARGDEGKLPTSPMPSAKVRPGWTGKTKEQVVLTPDFIPKEVRKTPRPYLEVPREYETEAMAAKLAKKAQNFATYAPTPAPTPTLLRSEVRMPLPPPLMPSLGRPTFTVTDHVNGAVEYNYKKSGVLVSTKQRYRRCHSSYEADCHPFEKAHRSCRCC